MGTCPVPWSGGGGKAKDGPYQDVKGPKSSGCTGPHVVGSDGIFIGGQYGYWLSGEGDFFCLQGSTSGCF